MKPKLELTISGAKSKTWRRGKLVIHFFPFFLLSLPRSTHKSYLVMDLGFISIAIDRQ